jgi:hypothetical protein
VRIVYGSAVWLEEVGFGRCGAFVLCPADVVVKEHLLSGNHIAFEAMS